MRLATGRVLWISLFVGVLCAVAFFATTSNVVFFQRAEDALTEFRSSQFKESSKYYFDSLRWSWWMGVLASFIAVGGLVLFFIKSQQEMSLNLKQKEFFARASHELRSPVTSIQLSSALLKNSQASWSEEQNKIWCILEAELLRLRLEMDSVLEASKSEVFGIRPRLKSIELENWIREHFEVWRQMLGPAAVLVREGEILSVMVETDFKWLELITNNLIDNARKFAKEDQVPKVEVHTGFQKSGKDPRWFIKFKDAGQGFNPNDSKKIFRRFHRTEEASKRPGSGLGLFLVKKGVKALGLQIEAESLGLGKGATFRLSGPL